MRNTYIVFVVMVTMLIVTVIGYNYIQEQAIKTPLDLYKMPHYIRRTAKQQEEVRNNIPLIIYESWKTHEVPKGMRDNIHNLLKMNPEFDYYLYSDEDCAAFIRDNYDEDVLSAFHMLKPGAYKSDLWRYCILYKLGGVYLDIKYYSTVPLVDIIDEVSTVYVKDTWKGCLYNAFLISPPKNEIFKMCIDDIVNSCRRRLYKRNLLDITGPCLLGAIVRKEYSDGYFSSIQFEHHASLFMYRSITYKGKTILKEYDSYRLEQRQSEGKHYVDLYAKGDIYA